jgi:molybdopterin molybdotransferase
MKTTQETLSFLMEHAKCCASSQKLATQAALGHILAEDLVSSVNVPAQDNSQMDGYAVRVADIQDDCILPISQRIPAGHPGQPLQQGTVARIFTGAVIPNGADAVVMQEDCEVSDSGVRIQVKPKVGDYIRRQGEDLQIGRIALTNGTRLDAQHLGVVAAMGLTHVQVFRKIRVAAFFTGDELVMPGQALKPGGIYNSNRDTLLALVKSLGCEVTDLGIVPDSLDATRQTLRQAAQDHDLIVTSGGVSVGEEDHIKPAVQAEGQLNLWQIAMKPGKPFAFGQVQRQDGHAWFMGLPGNPVASFVTFLIFARPFIHALQGRSPSPLRSYTLRADFDWSQPDRRNEFLRVKVNEQGGLDLFPNQSSGVLTGAAWADGLLDNPPGLAIQRGDMVKYIPYASFFN